MQTVYVTPADAGWAVRSDAIDNTMIFRSGAKAEGAARRLAQALAILGDSVEISIQLRDGNVARRFVSPPAAVPRTADVARYVIGAGPASA